MSGVLRHGERVEYFTTSTLDISAQITAAKNPQREPDLMFFGIPIYVEKWMEPNTIRVHTTQRSFDIKVTPQ